MKNKDIKAESIVSLYHSFGSLSMTNDSVSFVKYSDFVISAWDGDKLVGLVTAVDDTSHAICVCFLVHPDYCDLLVREQLTGLLEKRYSGYKITYINEK